MKKKFTIGIGLICALMCLPVSVSAQTVTTVTDVSELTAAINAFNGGTTDMTIKVNNGFDITAALPAINASGARTLRTMTVPLYGLTEVMQSLP